MRKIAPLHPEAKRVQEIIAELERGVVLPVPIPEHDFDRIPTIQGGPYDYGLPDAVPALGNGADPGALR